MVLTLDGAADVAGVWFIQTAYTDQSGRLASNFIDLATLMESLVILESRGYLVALFA